MEGGDACSFAAATAAHLTAPPPSSWPAPPIQIDDSNNSPSDFRTRGAIARTMTHLRALLDRRACRRQRRAGVAAGAAPAGLVRGAAAYQAGAGAAPPSPPGLSTAWAWCTSSCGTATAVCARTC